MSEILSARQIERENLGEWRFGVDMLKARFETGSFVRGTEFLVAITELAEAANHHPDVVLTYPRVDISLTTHDAGGVTSKDVALAREISQLAGEKGIAAGEVGE